MKRISTQWVLLAVVTGAVEASASGFYFGDNGTKLLSQGGAFTGQADDLTAIQHNPAGLAQLDGVSFLADLNLVKHEVTFLRQEPGFDPSAPNTKIPTVENKAGIFPAPFLAGSYGLTLGTRTLTLGLGVYGPPAVGRYSYPNPDYSKDATGKYVTNPIKYAPNRYALIDNNILILYPTLTAAIDLHPRLLVGASLQAVYSTFAMKQAVYSGVSTPTRMQEEDPIFDSVVSVNLTGRVGVTGIVGVLWKPTDTLSFGASARPRIRVVAAGDLSLQLGEAAAGLGTKVSPDKPQAELTLTLPLEVRVGAMFRPTEKLRLVGDFVYQGWDSIDALTLTPTAVTMAVGSSAPAEVPPMLIPKHWAASYSGRAGASYDVIPMLTARAGVLYETSAVSDRFHSYSIDFAHPTRFFLTAGASVHLSNVDLVAGAAFTPPTTTVETASDVLQGQTDSTVKGNAVGNGVYTSGGWLASIGVNGHFGAPKEPARPLNETGAAPTATPASPPVTP